MTLTDSRKQATCCLKTLTNRACVTGVNGEQVQGSSGKARRRRVWKGTPIPIKKPVSNKQLSLTFSTRKIKKKKPKERYAHSNTRGGHIFINHCTAQNFQKLTTSLNQKRTVLLNSTSRNYGIFLIKWRNMIFVCHFLFITHSFPYFFWSGSLESFVVQV